MMNNFKNNIDKLVSRILNEEIESKVKQLSKVINEGEWTEIEMDEELKGRQKKIDVAEPKGKITAADFKKLRDAKSHKKEVEEWFFYNDEESEGGEDFEKEDVGMEMGRDKFNMTRKPKMVGSFDDEHGFYDQDDRQYTGDFDFDYDEEEFDDFDSFDSKYSGKQSMFAPGKEGKKYFNSYKDKFGGKPFRVRTPRDMGESETEEGNAFTGALAKAKKEGDDDFSVDGKKYNVKESKRRLSNQMNLASILKSAKENVKSLKLTEDELIDMIEKIVVEQKVKDKSEKPNIPNKEPQGLKDTNKVLAKNRQENDDYAKEVVKKMKEYVKAGSKGEYTESPEDFPKSNYQMEKDAKVMKYNPSDAVEEYIEAFAFPGMTNLVYDEIKPDDEKIDKYLKGDATTGNAITDKDGKALGNVSKGSTKVGERFKKNFDDNLYGAEQMNVSYKRQSQPVDVAGDGKESGSLKDKRGGKSSTAKAQQIMNQLESTEDKKSKIISEEMNKMKNLIGYDRKTQ
jgi:hypothetical protein